MIPPFVESQKFIAAEKCTIPERIKRLHKEDSCRLRCYCRLVTFADIYEKLATYIFSEYIFGLPHPKFGQHDPQKRFNSSPENSEWLVPWTTALKNSHLDFYIMRPPHFVINVPHSRGLPWDRIWVCAMKSRWMNSRVLTQWKAYTKCNSSLAFNDVQGSRFSVRECSFLLLQVMTDTFLCKQKDIPKQTNN